MQDQGDSLGRSVCLGLPQEQFSLTSHLTQVLLIGQQLLQMSLVLVLNQHACDLGYLLVAEGVLKARIDQVAHHLLTLLLISKTFDQLQTEVLRKWNVNLRCNNFSLSLLLWLSLLFGLRDSLFFVLRVRNCLTSPLNNSLSSFRFLDLLRLLLFTNAVYLVTELIDLFHKFFSGSLLSFSIKINLAHPKLNVNRDISKNTCFMKVSDCILATVHTLEKDAGRLEAAYGHLLFFKFDG